MVIKAALKVTKDETTEEAEEDEVNLIITEIVLKELVICLPNLIDQDQEVGRGEEKKEGLKDNQNLVQNKVKILIQIQNLLEKVNSLQDIYQDNKTKQKIKLIFFLNKV